MKKILPFLLLLSSAAFGQTTYSIRADSTKLEKVGGNNELILLNSTRNVKGFLYNKGNGRTEFRTVPVNVNLPLYLSGDTINLNQSDANNDGYLTANDWSRFDSAAGMWKDTLTGLPAITPKGKMVFANRFLLGPNSAIAYYNTAWDANPYPIMSANPQTQNAYYGDRGGATRYLNGTAVGTENTGMGSQTFFALTGGGGNTALGKGAGGLIENANNTIYIGKNMTGGSFENISSRLGIGVNGTYWILGENNGADMYVSQAVIATGDSTKKIATTEWVKRQGYGTGGGGGITDLTPEETFATSDFTITEGADGRDKTYIVIPPGTAVTVTAPASPTAGRRITIYLQYLTPGSSVIVPTWDGPRTLTTSGTSFTLQWSATLGGYIIVGNS
jgi:hypothetical protein